MTKQKSRTLSQEILGYIARSAIISILLFWLLSKLTTALVESYCFDNQIYMSEYDWLTIDHRIFIVAVILACITFTILFLSQLSNRIAYIHKIKQGIDALYSNTSITSIPLEGNNELTTLASTINEVSQAQNELRQKEKALALEKENLIRTLGHDIRTPLTSILSYSEYLLTQKEFDENTLILIKKKAEQIRDLTNILLDGNKRNLEYFENGKLLFEQMLDAFSEELEDHFNVIQNTSQCSTFSANFDIQELQRIFDNLASNIQKYADAQQPIYIDVSTKEDTLILKQTNSIAHNIESSGHQIGLHSIKRIAQLYHGRVQIEQTETTFTITIILSYNL